MLFRFVCSSSVQVPELRGLDALFDVTIKALKDRIYPTLDDEFAQKVSDAKDMTELKEKVSACAEVTMCIRLS